MAPLFFLLDELVSAEVIVIVVGVPDVRLALLGFSVGEHIVDWLRSEIRDRGGAR